MDIQERYAIYHANDLFAMITPQAAHWYTDRSRHYTHVADVVAPLEQVFALTNHIDHPGRAIRRWSGTAPPPRCDRPRSVMSSFPWKAARPGW